MSHRLLVARTWRQHRLGLLALLAIVALLLGFVGYLQAGESGIDAAYSTLSLLAFNYAAPDGEIGLALQIARFMVPAVAAFATFSALVAVLEDQAHLVRAKRRRRHVVICGLGRRGMRLTRSIREGEHPGSLVIVESDGRNPNVRLARALGAIVVIGDATEVEILEAAGVHRAATLISVLPEDADNAAVASIARGICRQRSGDLSAFCHVADTDLVEELTSASVRSSGGGFTLEWFSVHERAARLLLAENAELVERSARSGSTHLVVVGADDLARSLVINAVRQWRALGSNPAHELKITIAWPGGGEWLRTLTDHHVEVADGAELVAYEHDLRSASRFADARAALSGANAVFVCGPTDISSLEHAFAVNRVLDAQGRVVVRLLIEQGGFVDMLSHDGVTDALHLFSVVDRACSYEMVTAGLYEELAQALHAIYEDRTGGKGARTAWLQLSEPEKAANRAQARDLSAKLHAAGCGLRPLSGDGSSLLEFDQATVERMAELENMRWNALKKQQGFVAGPETDEGSTPPTNKWIDVAWSDLPEDVAEVDRAFVRSLPALLTACGYDVYRMS